jgi:single-strand DNA-binding protein
MAGSVNKVILIGNLGADPEVRSLTSGAKVARLRIATSESYTNKEGERVTNTEWHSVNLWRGLADIAEKYLTKGSSVYVEGRLRTRSYDDKDGVTRYVTEIEGDNMTMLGGRSGDSNNSGGSSNYSEQQNAPEPKSSKAQQKAAEANDDEDDLPF